MRDQLPVIEKFIQDLESAVPNLVLKHRRNITRLLDTLKQTLANWKTKPDDVSEKAVLDSLSRLHDVLNTIVSLDGKLKACCEELINSLTPVALLPVPPLSDASDDDAAPRTDCAAAAVAATTTDERDRAAVEEMIDQMLSLDPGYLTKLGRVPCSAPASASLPAAASASPVSPRVASVAGFFAAPAAAAASAAPVDPVFILMSELLGLFKNFNEVAPALRLSSDEITTMEAVQMMLTAVSSGAHQVVFRSAQDAVDGLGTRNVTTEALKVLLQTAQTMFPHDTKPYGFNLYNAKSVAKVALSLVKSGEAKSVLQKIVDELQAFRDASKPAGSYAPHRRR